MFNRGVEALLAALPDIAGLDVEQIRRLLTRAWLETTTPRLGAEQSLGASSADLRRLATALELHAILPLEAPAVTVRACAFVAAEALTINHELEPEPEDSFWLFGPVRRFEQVEASLLYLVAGYDANAALTIAPVADRLDDGTSPDGPIVAWALARIVALCTMTPVDNTIAPGFDAGQPTARAAVRHELWRRIGVHVADHIDWLTFRTPANPSAGAELRALAERLERRDVQPPVPAGHADLHHLLLLLAAACDETTGRALRTVPPPPVDTDERFADYQRRRAANRPLLWPAAEDYARMALPGPAVHAVVAVPTGSGKSSVAELAVAQALWRGWVLYLAPTNALVGQIRRNLTEVFGPQSVREFIGGAEYTELAGESLEQIGDRQVLVMTPEKCSLALRQNPEAFAKLALCVLDEAHLLGERNGRGVIAELVLAEVMHRATEARLLLMSALIANPDALASWLQSATQQACVVVNEPWRPTRTLRAIAGIDRARANTAATAAYQQLQKREARRRNESFRAPLALLAGLQGPWTSSNVDDYALVQTDITVGLTITRDGNAVLSGYCTPATAAIVQGLGERGDKVLAFLPRSRHDSFGAARLTSFGQTTLEPTIEAFLLLADVELGVPTALRSCLERGVAVHTGALLREEQRASEVAFEHEVAVAMYATGTMAQGLNLPATAVVIGGTDIGYDETATQQQLKDKARVQLLNAIGRAGRAHVAPRSMAIVVPNKAQVLTTPADAAGAVHQAEFLRDEDAAAELVSALDGLITKVLNGDLSVDTMSAPEQTAFSFLAFAASAQSDTQGVVSRTWAVHRIGAQPHTAAIASAIATVGSEFLQLAGAPPWVSLAAHQSGLTLPDTVAIYMQLRARLASAQSPPTTIPEWADLLVDLLQTLPQHQLKRMLPPGAYGTSRLADIYNSDAAVRPKGWTAFKATLAAWMNGHPLIAVAEHVHKKSVNANAGRGPQDPIPRVIAIAGEAFRFGLPLVAGALLAIVSAGREHDDEGPWDLPDSTIRAINLLPLAIRSGADSSAVLAWMRAGVQPRVVAHMLNAVLPAPPDQSDDELQRWAFGQLKALADRSLPGVTTPEQDAIIDAVETARNAR